MVRFGAADPFDDETPAADSRGAAPVVTPGRRSRRLAAPRFAPTNPLLEQAFPPWARPPKEPAVGTDSGADAAFFAGVDLQFNAGLWSFGGNSVTSFGIL